MNEKITLYIKYIDEDISKIYIEGFNKEFKAEIKKILNEISFPTLLDMTLDVLEGWDVDIYHLLSIHKVGIYGYIEFYNLIQISEFIKLLFELWSTSHENISK